MDIITISLDAMDAYLDVCRLQVIRLELFDTYTSDVELTIFGRHMSLNDQSLRRACGKLKHFTSVNIYWNYLNILYLRRFQNTLLLEMCQDSDHSFLVYSWVMIDENMILHPFNTVAIMSPKLESKCWNGPDKTVDVIEDIHTVWNRVGDSKLLESNKFHWYVNVIIYWNYLNILYLRHFQT